MRVPSVLILASILGGCTKGSPTFRVLDPGAIPKITFQGQSERALDVGALNVATAVDGECDPRVRAITVTALGTSVSGALDVISTVAPTIACTGGGTFSFTLKSLNDLFGAAVANRTYVLEFRAETAGGVSNPSRLNVSYRREFPDRWRVTAGGSESGATPRAASSSSFRGDVRVTNFVRPGPATSPSYKMDSGRGEQARR